MKFSSRDFIILSRNGATSSVGATNQQQVADLDREVDMRCSGWTIENSKFEVPTRVMFTDVAAMMEKMSPATQGNASPTSNTSYCDAITNPQAEAACINAAGGYKIAFSVIFQI